VDCAGNQGQLALVGLTRDGKAWHTLRIPQRWRAFESIGDQAPPAAPALRRFLDVAAGYCNAEVPADGPRDVSQLNVVLTGDAPPGAQIRIWHAIRAANPVAWSAGATPSSWRPLEDLAPRINRTPSSPVPPVTNPALWGGFSVGPRPFWPY
jgi:hypothetical protein